MVGIAQVGLAIGIKISQRHGHDKCLAPIGKSCGTTHTDATCFTLIGRNICIFYIWTG